MMIDPLHNKFLHLNLDWVSPSSSCWFRDRNPIEHQTPNGSRLKFDILDIFPFTPESKHMGIVVRDA